MVSLSICAVFEALNPKSATVLIGFYYHYTTVYGIASPVIPFRLGKSGYKNVSELTGWLVAGEKEIPYLPLLIERLT